MRKRSELLLTILLLTFRAVSLGQTPLVESKTENWKTYPSEQGRFSVSFPGTPTFTTEKLEIPGGQFVLNKHMLETRATYGVIYADYPNKFETDTARREVLLNASKGAAGAIDAEILENTETSVQGHPARLLKEKLKNGQIIRAKMVLVESRLYQVAVTSPTPEKMSAEEVIIFDAASYQFLSSFKISTTEQTLGEVDQWIEDNGGREPVYGTCLGDDCTTMDKANTEPGRAIVFVKPEYPAAARKAGVSGTVKVQVIINEQGQIIAAQIMEGHPMLHAASIAAAKTTRFTPSKYKGQPAKVMGVLEYNFASQ